MSTEHSQTPKLVEDGLGGLTFQVIGLAMAVDNDLGPGHRESTYHSAMHQRLLDAKLIVELEPELPIYDESGNFVNYYRPDHRVDEQLLVEYKAHYYPISNDEVAQCLDYFTASNHGVLLIFNFGKPRLEWKRLFPPKHILAHRRKRWTKLTPDKV